MNENTTNEVNQSFHPNKQFFIELGNQLCNIKDSPFFRIGQTSKLQQKRTLDYDPNRLFKPDSQNTQLMDQTYKDFLKQENQQEQMLKIEYDILKKDTAKQYQKQLQKMEQMRRFQHKQPFTWFGVYRGNCVHCGSCGEYEGCFAPSQRFGMSVQGFIQNAYNESDKNSVQIMQCFKCKCPMNSHVPLPTQSTLRSQIMNILTKKSINDNHLKSSHIVLCFKLPQSNISYYYLIIQLLARLNCPAINYKCLTKLNFQLAMIKSSIIQNGNTQKAYIQSLINFIESIKIEKEWRWNDQHNRQRDQINDAYEQLYETVGKIGSQIQKQMNISQKQCVFVALCRYEIQNSKNLIRYLSRKDKVTPDTINRNVLSNSTTSTLSSNRNSHHLYGVQDTQTDVQILLNSHKICFIYGSNQHKQSLLLSQYIFKQNYELNYSIFMLPGGQIKTGANNKNNILNDVHAANQKSDILKQYEWNNDRFKDVLDYNSYIVFLENVRDVDRVKFQQVMTRVVGFRNSKIDYIMGQQMLNERIKKLSIKLCVKVGPQTLTLPFATVPDFISVKNTCPKYSQIPKMLSVLYPQFSYSQRCVLIIRPFAMTSSFQQTIVNLLRINHFVLVKRIQVKMSESQARYMATIQKIKQQIIQDYIKYMTSGVCQIILVSKRAAIYEAYALAQGCLNGPSDIITRPLKNTGSSNSITVQHKKNRDIYETQLPLYSNLLQFRNINFPNPSLQVFKSIRQMIDLQKVLFGYSAEPQFASNTKNGQIIKIDPLVSGSTGGSGGAAVGHSNGQQVSYKIKQSMLKQLKKQDFNFWVFTSKSEMLTEELAANFLPQCTLFQPITVIIKPGLSHLIPLIKTAILQHKYHIIVQKQIQMSRPMATEFVHNCQKIRLQPQTFKFIVQSYCKQKVFILCLSKIAGRREIMSMLNGFSFLTMLPGNSNLSINKDTHSQIGSYKQAIDTFVVDQYISDEMLCDMMVPVWNNEQLCLRAISEPLANLQQSVRSICQNGFYQQQIPKTMSKVHQFHVLNYVIGSFFGVPLLDLALNTRLGKLDVLIIQNMQVARLQSWYYSQISNIKPNYVPLLFQYRQIGQTVVCVQSDKGFPFMSKIIQMYNQQQQKFKATKQRNSADFPIRPVAKKNQRRSLVLFLWAKKLADMCLQLSKIQTQLKDFGQIVYKNGQFRGIDSLQIAQNQQLILLKKLQLQFQSHREIRQNIKKLSESRQQKQRYSAENKRLLPSFYISALSQCLRVIQKTQTSKLNLMDKYPFVDPENEVSKLKDLYSLHLFNVLPQIRTKYAMIAQIYYFFLRAEYENSQLSQMIGELQTIFTDMLTSVEDLQVLQFQIYLRFLLQFIRMQPQQQFKGVLFGILKTYPNLRKNKRIQRDDVAGKKRKFIEHNQYFQRNNEQSQQIKQVIQKKYTDFDLNQLKQQPKPTTIYNPKDPFHFRLANTENRVNLLRDNKSYEQRNGIYVEFQKNISQKQELLKQKIKKQAEKFNFRHQNQILRETGLQKELWYRKTKGDQVDKPQTKTNKAIQKQIQRFLSFKKQQKN